MSFAWTVKAEPELGSCFRASFCAESFGAHRKRPSFSSRPSLSWPPGSTVSVRDFQIPWKASTNFSKD